jgi:hypothetical protein
LISSALRFWWTKKEILIGERELSHVIRWKFLFFDLLFRNLEKEHALVLQSPVQSIRGGKSRFLPFYYSYSKPLREVRCFPEIFQSPMRKRCFWNIIAFLRTCIHGASFLFSIGYYYNSTTRRTRCHWMMGGVSFGVSLLPREKKHHVLPLFLGKIITSVS